MREVDFRSMETAADDDELVARNLDVDVFEVVLARSFDDAVVPRHCLGPLSLDGK